MEGENGRRRKREWKKGEVRDSWSKVSLRGMEGESGKMDRMEWRDLIQLMVWREEMEGGNGRR